MPKENWLTKRSEKSGKRNAFAFNIWRRKKRWCEERSAYLFRLHLKFMRNIFSWNWFDWHSKWRENGLSTILFQYSFLFHSVFFSSFVFFLWKPQKNDRIDDDDDDFFPATFLVFFFCVWSYILRSFCRSISTSNRNMISHNQLSNFSEYFNSHTHTHAHTHEKKHMRRQLLHVICLDALSSAQLFKWNDLQQHDTQNVTIFFFLIPFE